MFSAADAEEIEEIKVTGSYIGSRANDIGTEIIDQTDFKNLNVSTVGEISKYLASAAGAHFQSNTLDGCRPRHGIYYAKRPRSRINSCPN